LAQTAEVSPRLISREDVEETRAKVDDLITTGYESLDALRKEYSDIKFDLSASQEKYLAYRKAAIQV
jgi:hypothetical protein